MNAIQEVLKEEDSKLAGKVVNLKDGAGMTRFGITSKNHPELIPTGFFSTMPTALALTVAEGVYSKSYAKPLQISGIGDAALGRAVLSFGVNAGVGTSARMLQQACNSFDIHVAVDGCIGPGTLKAVNMICPSSLLATFSGLAKAHYAELAEADSSKAKWLRGWNSRVNGWTGAA